MKKTILTIAILLCSISAYAHEFHEEREFSGREGRYEYARGERGWREHDRREYRGWRPERVVYRSERHEEPRLVIPLPPPLMLLPPFIFFR